MDIACKGDWFATFDCVSWLWNGKAYDFYNYPGADATIPLGINNRGEQVGQWVGGPGPFPFHGYIRDKSGIHNITAPGFNGPVDASAYDINDNGVILGSAQLESDPLAFYPSFLLQKGEVTLLPEFENVLRTFYNGINNRRDGVGIYFTSFDPNGPPPKLYGFVALRKGH